MTAKNKNFSYIETHFVRNIGLGVLNFHILQKNKYDKVLYERQRNPEKAKRRLQILLKLFNKKLTISSFEKQQNEIKFLKNFQTTFSCVKNTQKCKKALCSNCIKYEFYYKLCCHKTGSILNTTSFVFNFLEYSVNCWRSKIESQSKNYPDSFIYKKKIYIKYSEWFDTLTSLSLTEYHEKSYPSTLKNIVIFQIRFDPVALSENKEVIHPIFGSIANLFVEKKASFNANKNILNLLNFYKHQILSLLTILPDQLTGNRSKNSTKTTHYSRVKPNSSLNKAYRNISYTSFPTTLHLKNIFNDVSFHGLFTFKCIEMGNTQYHGPQISLTPTVEEKQFITSYNLWDTVLQKLQNNFIDKANFCNDMVHLFSFNGIAFFHSFLSQHSLLVQLKHKFHQSEQFNFMYLSEFSETKLGIDIIKYCIYEKNKNMQQTHSLVEQYENFSEEAEENESWPIKIGDNHLNYELQLKFTFQQIKTIEHHISTLPKDSINIELINLRFQEIIVFLQAHHFDSCLGKPKIIEQFIIDEVCLFMIFEAVTLTQNQEIIDIMEKNISNENLLKKTKLNERKYQGDFVNTINFFEIENNKKILKNDTSQNQYLEHSIFFFPKQKKYLKYMETVIKNNIAYVENLCLNHFLFNKKI